MRPASASQLFGVVCGVVLLLGLFGPTAAAADPCPPICIGTEPGGFGGGGTQSDPPVTGDDPGAGGQPASLHPREFAYAPACSGNSPSNEADVSCVGATTSCPVVGQVRYWVFARDWVEPTGYGPWQRVQNPPSVCSFGVPAANDPRAAVIALVQRDWKTFGLNRGTVDFRPADTTLINVPTRLFTTTPGMQVLTRTIFGLSVTVVAHAQSYTWRCGDGSTMTTGGPGGPATDEVTHTYRTDGPVKAAVEITYRGEFTVGTDPTVIPIVGTALVAGPQTGITVRSARTQLEAGTAG